MKIIFIQWMNDCETIMNKKKFWFFSFPKMSIMEYNDCVLKTFIQFESIRVFLIEHHFSLKKLKKVYWSERAFDHKLCWYCSSLFLVFYRVENKYRGVRTCIFCGFNL